MNDDGRCNGYTTAMTAMERGGDSNDTHTSNGRHRGMLARYGRASVHLELSSFGYKYGAPPPPLAGRLYLRLPPPVPGRT